MLPKKSLPVHPTLKRKSNVETFQTRKLQRNTFDDTSTFQAFHLNALPLNILHFDRNMKNNSLKEKFNSGVNFVKPLYKKVKFRSKIENKVLDCNVGTKNQGGDGIRVNKTIVNNRNRRHKTVLFKENRSQILPGVCQGGNESVEIFNKYKNIVNLRPKTKNMSLFGIVASSSRHNNEYVEVDGKADKVTQICDGVVIHKIPDHWLRVYPASKTAGEPTWSVVFRCVVCQLGLVAVLILWTLLWGFVIFSVEEPYEREVSIDFQEKQNQLVIDLATELRQITPLSPKWRESIEKRIENERQLTERAVAQGARHDQGHFWDLPGTFLFTIYVMTALGFGAPVPQTLSGRTSALMYAILAVPTHIYLMVNASACIVANMEALLRKLNKTSYNGIEKASYPTGKSHSQQCQTESPNCSGISDMKTDAKLSTYQSKLLGCFNMIWIGRGVPLAFILYYTVGVVGFGVMRNKAPLETLMFPIEFTTTGGLERVTGSVRVLYGLYVEGAMSLLACALATLRRHSSDTVRCMTDRFRLFNSEQCMHCRDGEVIR